MRWLHRSCSAHSRADEQPRCGREVVWFWPPGAEAKLAVPFDEHRKRRGQQSRSPRRSRISVKTIARGRPGVSARPVVTAACFFCCRRAMGAASARPSSRPLHEGGRCRMKARTRTRREDVGARFHGCVSTAIMPRACGYPVHTASRSRKPPQGIRDRPGEPADDR